MASCAPIVPIDGDCVPGLVLGLSLVGPVVPGPIPLGLLPGCCASARGAVTKTTARANMMVLLSLLLIDILLFLQYTFYFISRPPHLGCTALRRASSRHRAFQETLS